MKRRKEFSSLIHQFANKYSETGNDITTLISSKVFQMNEKNGIEFIQGLIQRSSFLQQLNIILVSNPFGAKQKGRLIKPVTGRAAEFERYYSQIETDEFKFQLQEVDSGALIKWELFDHFAGFFHDNLEEVYSTYILNQIIADMLQIGWYGENIITPTIAEDMSDVNKGWLKLLQEQKPENFISSGKEVNKIKLFGDDADYTSLNKLALTLRQRLDKQHQHRNDLVFLVGSDLLSREENLLIKEFDISNSSELSAKYFKNLFGGMVTITPPNFPTKGAVVTTLRNLSIYTDPKTWRYSIRNDEDYKQIINSLYRHECYVIEDPSLMAAINHHNVILD